MPSGKYHVIDGCYYLLQIALAGFLFKLEGTLRMAEQTRTVTDNMYFPPVVLHSGTVPSSKVSNKI